MFTPTVTHTYVIDFFRILLESLPLEGPIPEVVLWTLIPLLYDLKIAQPGQD